MLTDLYPLTWAEIYEAQDTANTLRLLGRLDTGLNWDLILRDLDWAEAESDEPDEPGIQSIWIGTVFSLHPSGKYWTCISHANVTDAEAEADIAWCNLLEAEAEARDCWVELGEGDPCDVYICRWEKP